MNCKIPIFFLVLFAATLPNATAQDEPNYIIPNPLFLAEDKPLAELRDWSIHKWLTVRRTNHPLYHYVLEAAQFRSYVQFCRRHDLNVDMTILNEMALKNLSEIVAAHYEEEEWVKLNSLNEDTSRHFIADVGQDIYAFEFATAIAAKKTAKEASGTTTKVFCSGIGKENHNSYIALRATAKRQLNR